MNLYGGMFSISVKGLRFSVKEVESTVSIVMPVRGKSHLLLRALTSCLFQTIPPTEILLIDDNTDTDEQKIVKNITLSVDFYINTAKIATSLVPISSGGAGAASARNLGIKHSKSNFIAFLDADDYFLPDKLATQVLAMLKSDVDISHTNYFTRNIESGISSIVDTSFNQGHSQDSVISFRDCSIATPTVMFKKSLLTQDSEIFPKGVAHGEDLVAWARLCQISSKPLLHIKEALTVVELNATSSARSSSNIQSAKMHLAKNAQIYNIKPLKIYEYGGIKNLIVRTIPVSPRKIAYFLNLLRAVKGK
jgi:glycosyltransferase involved in cell wall biosynthesis